MKKKTCTGRPPGKGLMALPVQEAGTYSQVEGRFGTSGIPYHVGGGWYHHGTVVPST